MSDIYDFVRRRWPGVSKASAKRLSLVGNQCAYKAKYSNTVAFVNQMLQSS